MQSFIFFSLPFLFAMVGSEVIPQPPADPNAQACPAQPVLDACISSTSAIASACPLTDYNCLCQKNTDVLTCFNVCPNDPRRSSTLSLQASYCANQSIYSSLSSPTTHPMSLATQSSSASAIATATASATVTPKPNNTTEPSPTKSSESTGSKISASILGLLCVGIGFMLV